MPNNSLERTPPQPDVENETRSTWSGLLRCMIKAGPLSSQPLAGDCSSNNVFTNLREVREKDFSRTYEVKWSDLDPNGHVRHSVYDDYAADSRIRWLEESGFPPAKFSEDGFGPVILRQESRFYREVTIEDAITVTIRLAGLSPDGSRWKVHHAIIKSDGEKAAVLKIEGTWLDLKTRQATVPPSDLLQLFEELEKSKNFEELRSLIRKG